MPALNKQIPLSLYIHMPWCVQKCPYCDFNSHEMKQDLPQELYVNALIQELESKLEWVQERPLKSIFFGGGTPSLFSPAMIAKIIDETAKRIHLPAKTEITLEANPGTVDQNHFAGFYAAGINRLSLGIQSLQDEKLKILGRIHDSKQALRAIQFAKQAGFTNFNMDIMYGLPQQDVDQALQDIQTALDYQPAHFSWYQLTIEPNTLFYKQRPALPHDDLIWDMQLAGQDMLKKAGFLQYEVSAYAQTQKECVHNRNYWEFGDYLGIGAGAHSKITDAASGKVFRSAQIKQPKDYLVSSKRHVNIQWIADNDLIFEFMLNTLRLKHGVPSDLFYQRTGLALEKIQAVLLNARKRKLLIEDESRLCATELGMKFLNDLVGMFLI